MGKRMNEESFAMGAELPHEVELCEEDDSGNSRGQCGRDVDFSDQLFEEWREANFEDHQVARSGGVAQKE